MRSISSKSPCPCAAGTRKSAIAMHAIARMARPRSQKRSVTPIANDRPPYLAPYWKRRSGAIELERARGKYAALDLWRLPDRPLEPRIDLERAAPLPFAYSAGRLVHAPRGELEFRERVDRRLGARLAPCEKLVVAKRDARFHRKLRRLGHLFRVDGKLLHDDLLALLRVDWNLVCRDSPGFAIRSFVFEFERGEPENALAHRADAVCKRTRDRDFARTEKTADALRVSLGLRAEVVDLPVFLGDVFRKRRRMESRKVRIADEVDCEDERIANLRVVHVEIGARRKLPARHAGKTYRRQKKNSRGHRDSTL